MIQEPLLTETLRHAVHFELCFVRAGSCQPAYFDEGEAGVLGQLRAQGRLAGVGASLQQDRDQAGTVSRRRLSEYEI